MTSTDFAFVKMRLKYREAQVSRSWWSVTICTFGKNIEVKVVFI